MVVLILAGNMIISAATFAYIRYTSAVDSGPQSIIQL